MKPKRYWLPVGLFFMIFFTLPGVAVFSHPIEAMISRYIDSITYDSCSYAGGPQFICSDVNQLLLEFFIVALVCFVVGALIGALYGWLIKQHLKRI